MLIQNLFTTLVIANKEIVVIRGGVEYPISVSSDKDVTLTVKNNEIVPGVRKSTSGPRIYTKPIITAQPAIVPAKRGNPNKKTPVATPLPNPEKSNPEKTKKASKKEELNKKTSKKVANDSSDSDDEDSDTDSIDDGAKKNGVASSLAFSGLGVLLLSVFL